MNILLVSATEHELIPFIDRISNTKHTWVSIGNVEHHTHLLSFLVTGIGGIATSTALSAYLVKNQHDLIVNVGIAGSFSNKYVIGDAVLVSEDIFADLGVEEADGSFRDLFETGLLENNQAPYIAGVVRASTDFDSIDLPRVRSISVNKVHGYRKSIQSITEKYNPDIETMEGAAFFYTCHFHGRACIQLRTISNFVEPRDREKWNIPLAVESLALTLDHVLEVLA